MKYKTVCTESNILTYTSKKRKKNHENIVKDKHFTSQMQPQHMYKTNQLNNKLVLTLYHPNSSKLVALKKKAVIGLRVVKG